ncbi:MAG: hypothetical protein KC910_37120, partial [Candidatus Eremiobacteraeota bacterium]|nr:hypothetical protein [Candidatus Eremiobacteraeota bacterium]
HGGSLRKDQPAVLFVTAPLPKEKVNVQVDRQLSDQSQPPGSSRARRYLNLLVLQLAVVLAARYLYSEAEPKEGESSSLRIDLLELRS